MTLHERLVLQAIPIMQRELRIMIDSYSTDRTIQGISNRREFAEAKQMQDWIDKAREGVRR